MPQKEFNRSILIAGPCAAESRTQIVETAQKISALYPEQEVIFRAGVWKPRTNPHTFQGIGTKALEWLREAKTLTSMPVATEVATPEHIVQAMQAGVDYLWLGARTTANPILVQQLANTIMEQPMTLRRTLRAVLVKNPVNEDANLWIGDIERIEHTGVATMAIHRGCGHRPCWAMAHTLRKQRHDIPLLLDPSHLGGSAEKIAPLMRYAQNLGFDGAMIETHPNPEEALSDAKQQITPRRLKSITDTFPMPYSLCEHTELNWLRAEIDEIDDLLWATIARRMEVSQRIGDWKKAHAMPALQQGRFTEILQQRIEWAAENGLSAEMVENIFHEIHRESLRKQE